MHIVEDSGGQKRGDDAMSGIVETLWSPKHPPLGSLFRFLSEGFQFVDKGRLTTSWQQTLGASLVRIVSMSSPGYPSAWLRPRRARFHFARQNHCSSTTSIRLNFRMRRHPTVRSSPANNSS
jgi:hypothetical protein